MRSSWSLLPLKCHFSTEAQRLSNYREGGNTAVKVRGSGKRCERDKSSLFGFCLDFICFCAAADA